jgi:hypothetical protein
MSRAQEVSLARLLRVYESKIASSSGRGAVPDANGTPSARAAGDGAPGLGAYTDGGVDADASTRRAPSSQDRGAFLVDRRDDDADAEGVDSHPETVALKRRQHVDAMRALLARVRTANPDAADAYAERVDAVAAWVATRGDGRGASGEFAGGGEGDDDESPPAEAAEAAEASTGGAPASTGGAPASTERDFSLNALKAPFSVAQSPRSSRPRARARADGGSRLALSARGEASMRRHRSTQDALTDDLVGLAGAMRSNAGAMERSLRESRAGLASLERDLDANVAATTSANRRQKKLLVTFRSAGCVTWLALFAVGLVFSWVFVYVRVTSDKIRRIR